MLQNIRPSADETRDSKYESNELRRNKYEHTAKKNGRCGQDGMNANLHGRNVLEVARSQPYQDAH